MEGNIITNTMKMVAINFADWIAKNGIKPSCVEGMWLIPENDNEFEDIKTRIASPDLYEMFLEAERRRIEINNPKLQLPLGGVSGRSEQVCEHIWMKQEPLFGKSDFKCTECGIVMEQTCH